MTKNLIILLSLPLISFATEQRAVMETNYYAGAGYSDSDTSNSYSVIAGITHPLTKLLAASLSADVTDRNGKDNIVDDQLYSLTGTIFIRNSELGRLGASYTYSQTNLDVPASVTSNEINSNTYRLDADYYMARFTLGAGRGILTSDELDDFNYWSLNASWYANDNLKITGYGMGMDAEDTYGLSLISQPALFNNSASIALSYADSDDTNRIGISMIYFFDTRVTLIDRDRKYR